MAVRDSRNRRVPGLYVRNGRYYGQLWVEQDNKKTARRFPLLNEDGLPVSTLNEAKEAFEIKRHDRRENVLPSAGRKPMLFAFIETYFGKAEVARKKPGTIQNEKQALERWKAHLGDIRVDRIQTPMIAAYKDKRLRKGLSPRTVNLDIIALRNVLKWAVEDGHLRDMPKAKTLKAPTPEKRRLLTPEEFESLLAAIPAACEKNAAQFTDYLQFLAYSGTREQEALRVRWKDVDMSSERVTIGTGGVSKNRESREVDFNDKLGALLREMKGRRAPDCSWLFPSPQRGPRDEHARTFRESLKLARKKAGLTWMGFHDLRHFFASFCVMCRIDFMTISEWLGHKDGGILVGKVYGHLLEEHRRLAARSLRFNTPAPVPA